MIQYIKMTQVCESNDMDVKQLLGKQKGETIKEAVIKQLSGLNKMDKTSIIEIDFTDAICDAPFIDQAVFEIQRYVRSNYKESLLVFSHMEQNILDNMWYVINTHMNDARTIPILYKKYDGYDFLGNLETFLYSTMRYIFEHGEATTRQISEASGGIALNSASNRLKKLYDMGLVLRTELKALNGKQYRYYIPKFM